ncbi:MAG: hypothetical protein ACLU9N_02855 [Clostridia bacterium]
MWDLKKELSACWGCLCWFSVWRQDADASRFQKSVSLK